MTKKKVIRLWHKFAEDIVGQLGGHANSHKCVGAVVINKQTNRIISYGYNGIPDGIDIEAIPATAYEEGIRSHCNACAEPNALAKPLGVKAQALQADDGRLPEQHLGGIMDRVRWYLTDIGRVGAEHQTLKGHYMAVSVSPCLGCARLIINNGLEGVIARRKPRFGSFKRADGMVEARMQLMAEGVRIAYVSKRKLKFHNWHSPAP